MMRLTSEACAAFERALNELLDGELPSDRSHAIRSHLDGCAGCRDYFEDLQQMVQLHRDADAAFEETEIEPLIDEHALFAGVTRRLLGDKRDELIRLFYELGKAYVVAGGRHRTRQRGVLMRRPAVDIRRAMHAGRALAREGQALEARAGRQASLFGRSRRLFVGARAGGGALSNGRRLLHEALRLRPACDEARFWLAVSHSWDGRDDLARVEFRRVHAEGGTLLMRMMALQYLGFLHTWVHEHEAAIRCFEDVVASGVEREEPKMYVARLNLAVSCVHAGRVGRAVREFTELLARFPERVTQMKGLLAQQTELVGLLHREQPIQAQLSHEVPALFAT